MVNLRTNAAFHHLASSRHQANFLPGRHYRRKMIARCITSCRERNGNAAPRSNRGWWPRLEYLDRRRDQVDAVPPSLQADTDGGRSRYKTCQGTVFEAGLHRLARLPVDPLRTFQIGKASCRDRVDRYVYISVVAVS